MHFVDDVSSNPVTGEHTNVSLVSCRLRASQGMCFSLRIFIRNSRARPLATTVFSAVDMFKILEEERVATKMETSHFTDVCSPDVIFVHESVSCFSYQLFDYHRWEEENPLKYAVHFARCSVDDKETIYILFFYRRSRLYASRYTMDDHLTFVNVICFKSDFAARERILIHHSLKLIRTEIAKNSPGSSIFANM